MANERDENEGSGQQPPISQDNDEQTRGENSQQSEQSQQQFRQGGQQGGIGSDPSGGTLGGGQSGGFGNQTSASPQGSTGTEFGQQRGESAFGQQGQSAGGQSDLGSQSDTTLAGRADQQDLGQDQPGSSPTAGLQGTSGSDQGEGFIGSQGTGSDDYLQERDSQPAGFAEQGQGAPESGSENIETGQQEDRDSDIEGGSGNI